MPRVVAFLPTGRILRPFRLSTALCLALVIVACGKSTATYSGSGSLHFLLASEKGLTEVTDGKEQPLVRLNDSSYILDPAVSVEGRQLAFVRQPPAAARPDGSVDFGSDLYISDRKGNNARQVVRHEAVAEFIRTPAWLPDGTLLFTIRGRDKSGLPDTRIEVLDPKSGQRRRLIEDSVDPSVAPDGKSLLYLFINPGDATEQLIVADLGLGQRRPLAGSAQGLALITSARWSPDGRKIAFAAIDLNAPAPSVRTQPPSASGLAWLHPFAHDIWVVNRDGSGLRRLAELSETQPSLDWSHDGSKIYVLGTTGFWRIDATSGAREQVGLAVPLGYIRWLAP